MADGDADFDYAVCNKCEKHFPRPPASDLASAHWAAKVRTGKMECPVCRYIADDDDPDAARLQPPRAKDDRAREAHAATLDAIRDMVSGPGSNANPDTATVPLFTTANFFEHYSG